MKDNFDLKKYLIENKTIEKYNPFTTEKAKETLSEGKHNAYTSGTSNGPLREKIREMIISELSEEPISPEEEEDFINPGNPEEEAEKRKKYLDDFGMPPHMKGEEEGKFIDPAGGIHDEDEDDYAAMYIEEAKEEEEETEEETEETEEETEETEEEPAAEEGGGGIEDIAADMEGTEGEVMDHLMSALKVAKGMNNEKLTTQIGNTLKFFVSEYIGGEEGE